MDGDVIFNKDTVSGTTPPSGGQVPPPTVPAESTEIPLNQLPHDLKGRGAPVKPVGPPASGLGPPPPPPGGFPKGLLIKIAIGVVGLIIVLFLIFGVILPLFSRVGSDKEVSLTYWGLWESESTMNVLIRDFEKDHPNIKIKYIKQDPENYSEKLQAQIGSDTGPDIYRYHNTWVPLLKSDLSPLPVSVITPDEFKKFYYPVVPDDLSSSGPIYGVPLGIDTLALFINSEITRDFDPPKDWQDFIKVATSVTVIGGDGKIETAGAALGTMKNVTHAPDIMSMMMIQNGADLYGDVDSEKSKKAIGSAMDFYSTFASGQGKVWDDTLEQSLDAFAHERLAMYFGYSWDIFQIRAMNPDLQFEVHPIPGLPGGRNMTVASYWVEGVSAKSKHQKEAMEFMKYLTKKEALQAFYEASAKTREFGEIYPMPALGDTLKDNKLIYPFAEMAVEAESTYFVSDTFDASIDEQFNNYLSDAYTATIKDGGASGTAVDTLVNGINALKKQYNF
jgi:multiple sugar transport system substrate-binding protein